MRLVLADDHRIVRDGVRLMLEPEPEIDVVGEAADGMELLEVLSEVDTDAVLLDIRMPGVNGFDALVQIQQRAPDVKVVVMSMYDDPSYVRRAIELGASGYLLKSASKREILDALRAIAAGEAYVQSELTRALVEAVVHREDEPSLSDQQVQILGLVAEGLDNSGIAAEIQMSEASVKRALKAVFDALGVRTRSEAVAEAFRRGLLV